MLEIIDYLLDREFNSALRIVMEAMTKRMYPQAIRSYRKIRPEVKELHGQYIGDQLDGDINKWRPEKAVVLKGHTGCGKTTTVGKLVKKVIGRRGKMLIVTNRITLGVAYKKWLANITHSCNYYTDEGLRYVNEFKGVYVVSYQGLLSFIKENPHLLSEFEYVVMDEAHYPFADAEFSKYTGIVMNMIPRTFKSSVRIYMSATLDDIMPYIIKSELYQYEIKLVNGYERYEFIYKRNESQPYGCIDTNEYSPLIPIPLVYSMPTDYDRINLNFFKNEDRLIKHLIKSKDKTIIFTDTKSRGKKLAERLGARALYIDAKILRNNPGLADNLVENEAFDQQFLITTSVFCNGNNIKDKEVRNIVIYSLDPVDIKQMLGRRRLNGKNDRINLYLFVPEKEKIEKIIEETTKMLNMAHFYNSNRAELLTIASELIDSNNSDDGNGSNENSLYYENKIWKMVYIDSKEYGINYMAIDRLHIKQYYYKFLLSYIMMGNGDDGYCQMICSMLFNKEYSKDQWFGDDDADERKEFCDFLDAYRSKPMTEVEFVEFSKKCTELRIKLFGKSKSDNTGENRDSLKKVGINNRFKELNIPYRVKKEVEFFILTRQEEVDAVA